MKNSKMYKPLIPHFRKMDNDLQLITAQIIAGERTTRADLAKRVGKSPSWVSYAIPRIKSALRGVAVIESSRCRNNAGYHLRLLETDESAQTDEGLLEPYDYRPSIEELTDLRVQMGKRPKRMAASISDRIISHFIKNPNSVMSADDLLSGPVMERPDSVRAKLNLLCREGYLERVSPGRFRYTPNEADQSSDTAYGGQLGLSFDKSMGQSQATHETESMVGKVGSEADSQPCNSMDEDSMTNNQLLTANRERGRLPLWFIPPWTGAVDLRFVVAVDVADGRLTAQLNKGGYYRGPRHPEAEQVAAAMIESVTRLDGARFIVYGVDLK